MGIGDSIREKTSRMATSIREKAGSLRRKSGSAGKVEQSDMDMEGQLQTRETANPLWTDVSPRAKTVSTDFDSDEGAKKRCSRVRQFCFGTRRRALICMSVTGFFIILFTFLGVRASQALKLTETKPSFAKVSMGSLCSDKFTITVDGQLDNPAVVGASLQPTRSAIETKDGIVGYLSTPEIVVEPGLNTFEMQATFEVCESCADPLRQAMQRWLDGERIDYSLALDLTAKFPASVFIFPISFSTTMSFDSYLDSYFDPTLSFEERELVALEAAMRNETLVEAASLLSADNMKVIAQLELNMTRKEPDEETRKKNEEEGFGNYAMEIEVPALSFHAEVDGKPVATGSSRSFLFGTKEPLKANVHLTWDSVAGVDAAIVKYLAKSPMKYNLQGKYDKNLLPKDSQEACFLQTLVEGVAVRNTYEFFPKVLAYQAEQSRNDPAPAQLKGFHLENMTADGEFTFTADINFVGTKNYFNFQGEIPAMQGALSVNVTSTELYSMGRVDLLSPLVISDKSERQSEAHIKIDLDNATLVSQFVQAAAGMAGTFTPGISLQTAPDTLLGALVQSYKIDMSFNQPQSTGKKKARLLAEEEGSQILIENFTFNVSDTAVFVEMDVLGVTGTTLGFDLALEPANVTLGTFPFGDNTTEILPFFTAATSKFDSRSTGLDSVISISLELSELQGNSFAEGAFLADLLDRLFVEFKEIQLRFECQYDQNKPSVGLTPFQFTNWSAFPEGANDSLEVPSGSLGSFVAPKHVEIDGITSNAIMLSTALAFDVPGLVANTAIPALRLAVYRCTGDKQDSLVANVETKKTAVSLGKGQKNSAVLSLGLSFDDSWTADILDTASVFIAGNRSKFCIRQHSKLLENDFLSRLIAAFDFSFTVGGLSNDDVDTAKSITNSSNLALEIVSDSSSVCTNLEVNLTDANSAWDFSVGWGEISWQMTLLKTGERFFTWSAPEAIIGTDCNSPWATMDSCEKNSVVFTFCVNTDKADVAAGATVVRDAVQAIVFDQVPLPIQVEGYTKNRMNDTSEPTNIDARFTFPANGFQIVQGGASTSSLTVESLINSVNILSILETTAAVNIIAEDKEVFGSIRLTLPTIHAQFFKQLPGNDLDLVLSVAATVPPKSSSVEAKVEVTLSSWKQLFDTVVQIRDDPTLDLVVGRTSTPSNFLDRLLPRYTLSKEDSSSPVRVIQPSLDVLLTAKGSTELAEISILLTAIDDFLPVPVEWFGDEITFSTVDGAQVGTISLPENGKIGPNGTTSGLISVKFSGNAAPVLLGDLFRGNDVGLSANGKSGKLSFSFVLPKELVKAAALGTEEGSSGVSNSVALKQLSLLGGDGPGSNVKLPCLISSLCTNLLIDEEKETYSGLTVGVMYSIPDISTGSSVQFTLDVQTQLDLEILGNGLNLGKLTMFPFKISSQLSGPDKYLTALLRFDWSPEQIKTTRFAIDLVASGETLVMTFSGSSIASATFLSKLLASIEQDVFLEGSNTDPNADPVAGAFDLKVDGATSTEVDISASTMINYLIKEEGFNVFIPLGKAEASIFHMNEKVAQALLSANHQDGKSFILKPLKEKQPLGISVKGYRNQGDGPVTTAMNTLIQRFVFPDDIQLRVEANIVPPAEAGVFNPLCTESTRESNGCGFKVETWVTLAKSDSQSGFIDKFTMETKSIGSVFTGNAYLNAVKTLKNSLPFDIIVSYFQYKIDMFDTEGTSVAYECQGWTSPCYLQSSWCLEPFPNLKKNIIEKDGYVTAGNPSTGAASTLSNGQKYLPGSGTGDVEIVIDAVMQDFARMYHLYGFKNIFCADISDGRMIVGIQEKDCIDAEGTLTKDLKCTFVLDLKFNMYDFALLDGDTCRGPVGAQEDLDNPVTISSGYQWSPQTGIFDAKSADNVFWTTQQVSMRATFKLEFNLEYGSDGDDIEIIFNSKKSTSNIIGGLAINGDSSNCKEAFVMSDIGLDLKPKIQATMNLIKDSGSTLLTVIIDAYTQRVRFEIGNRFGDLDFNRNVGNFAGVELAYVGVRLKNNVAKVNSVILSYDRVDSTKTSLVLNEKGTNKLNPKENEMGYLTFQSRDKEGRRVGSGGEKWSVDILLAESSSSTVGKNDVTAESVVAVKGPCAGLSLALVSCSAESKTCICDLENGKYRAVFNLQSRGRYRVSVASTSAGIEPGKFVQLSDLVFVRQ